MKVCMLGSGSRGNAVYVKSGGTSLLFDAGFSGRELTRRLKSIDVDPSELSAIIVSHEHQDHVAGLRAMGRNFLVYGTAGTLAQVGKRFKLNGTETIRPGEPVRAGDIEFLPVPTSHDAADPVGFVVQDQDHRVAVMTDLGMVTRPVLDRLSDLSLAVIEANHDPDMLRDGPYPWHVKQRVKSRMGHLSNPDAAGLAGSIACGRLRTVLLAHLSEENNTGELAVSAVQKVMDGSGVRIEACRQDRPSPLFAL
ncbi:MAG: MBL fold metallo-hydrolase [bacterium]